MLGVVRNPDATIKRRVLTASALGTRPWRRASHDRHSRLSDS